MNFFKKLLSITLGVLTFITGFTSVFAGGRDGIEYLPDGTKQIFISTSVIQSLVSVMYSIIWISSSHFIKI